MAKEQGESEFTPHELARLATLAEIEEKSRESQSAAEFNALRHAQKASGDPHLQAQIIECYEPKESK